MSKQEKFSAVISLAAEMGGSVKSVFGEGKKEVDKLGRAMTLLYAKEKKVREASMAEGALKKSEARIERLLAQQKKAQALLDKNYGGASNKKAQKDVDRLAKEIDRAKVASGKERAALEQLDRELKRVGVDSHKLTQEQEKLGSAIDKADRKMRAAERRHKIGQGLMRVGAWGAAAVGVGVAGVAGMFHLDKSMGEDAKSIKNAAGAEGLSTDYVQGLRQAGLEAGLTFERTDAIVTRTTKNIDDALRKGKGNALGYVKRLGLDPATLRGVGMKKAWDMILDAIKNYKGADLGEILTGLGGKGSAKFANVKLGADGLREMIEHALKSGKFLSEDKLKEADEFELATMKFGGALKGLRNIIGSVTLEPFTEAFNEMTGTIEENAPEIRKWAEGITQALKEWIHSGKAKATLETIGGAIKDFIGFVKGLSDPFSDTEKTVKSLGIALGAAGLLGVMNPLGMSIAALGVAMIAATKAGDALGNFLDKKWKEEDTRNDTEQSYRIRAVNEANEAVRAAMKTGNPAEIEAARTKREKRWKAYQDSIDPDYRGENTDIEGNPRRLPKNWWGKHGIMPASNLIDNPQYKTPPWVKNYDAPAGSESSPSMVPNSPLQRTPVQTTNHNNFTFNITPAPGDTPQKVWDDWKTTMQKEHPALAEGLLGD